MSWSILLFTILGSVAGSLMYALLSERFGPFRGMLASCSVFLSMWIILALISHL